MLRRRVKPYQARRWGRYEDESKDLYHKCNRKRMCDVSSVGWLAGLF